MNFFIFFANSFLWSVVIPDVADISWVDLSKLLQTTKNQSGLVFLFFCMDVL